MIKTKINFHSIIFKFLLVFLLFGSMLVMITVSIQKDFSRTTVEQLTAAKEQQSLLTLEKNLGDGDWHVRDSFLFKGETPIGNGSLDTANTSPFERTEEETGSFVYCFIASSLADESVLLKCASEGKAQTYFLRAAGSTRDSNGQPIVGTFLDEYICSALKNDGIYSGNSFVEGRKFYCSYRVIKNTAGEIIGAVVAGQTIDEIERKSSKSALNSSLTIGVLTVYIFVSLFIFVSKWNRSLKKMEKHLISIGEGRFPEEELRINGSDELSEMAEVINDVKKSLIERERMRNELELARTIQAEMLPDDGEIKKLPESCSLTCFMQPAKEVGGDLYDFFMIDDRHLGLVIADVSDKGTPAALFMATAKMCIRDNMMLGSDPGEIMFRVSNQLYESSKSGLFVTAWIGKLDLSDGHLIYASAGHPFPFLLRVESGEYLPLRSDTNLVLAGIRNFKFRESETDLHPGDRLFLYTDGLDEARDKNGDFFGKKRIKEYLDGHAGAPVRETVMGMKAAVDIFAAGTEQFDDLTMLMAEFKGGKSDE